MNTHISTGGKNLHADQPFAPLRLLRNILILNSQQGIDKIGIGGIPVIDQYDAAGRRTGCDRNGCRQRARHQHIGACSAQYTYNDRVDRQFGNEYYVRIGNRAFRHTKRIRSKIGTLRATTIVSIEIKIKIILEYHIIKTAVVARRAVFAFDTNLGNIGQNHAELCRCWNRTIHVVEPPASVFAEQHFIMRPGQARVFGVVEHEPGPISPDFNIRSVSQQDLIAGIAGKLIVTEHPIISATFVAPEFGGRYKKPGTSGRSVYHPDMPVRQPPCGRPTCYRTQGIALCPPVFIVRFEGALLRLDGPGKQKQDQKIKKSHGRGLFM